MKILCVAVLLTLTLSTFSEGFTLPKHLNRDRHRHNKKLCHEFLKTNECPKGEHCRVKDGEAMCVKKRCVECVNDEEAKPMCGSDGITYKSYCQLRYTACTNDKRVHVACVGECPCEDRVDRVQHLSKINKFVPGIIHNTKDSDEYLQEQSDKIVEAEYRRKIERELKKNSRWQKWTNLIKSASTNVKKEAESWKEKTTCTKKDLIAMPSRLLDWFHVLKADNIKAERRLRKRRDLTELKYLGSLTLEDIKKEKGEVCHQPVSWMFEFLDSDKNKALSHEEIMTIEDIPYEHCMKPFFDSCNVGAPTDKFLTKEEFCKCFGNEETPCRKQLQQVPTAVIGGILQPLLGAWEPKCDEDGFFQPSQCHENQCWCVDRLGVEIEDSRKNGLVYCSDNTEAQDDEDELEEDNH